MKEIGHELLELKTGKASWSHAAVLSHSGLARLFGYTEGTSVKWHLEQALYSNWARIGRP